MPHQDAMQSVKLQRERFLAFSFAMADLLVELDSEGRISFLAGACRRFFGQDEGALMGERLIDRIAPGERALVGQLLKQLEAGRRIPPVEVLLDRVDGAPGKALLCGYALPGHAAKYMTLGAPERFRTVLAARAERDPVSGLHSSEGFANLAKHLIEAPDRPPGELTLTFMELDGLAQFEYSSPARSHQSLISEIAAFLRLQSVGGDAAGSLEEGRFGVITGAEVDHRHLAEGLVEAVPQTQQLGIETFSRPLAASDLSPDKASRALIYTLRRFQSEGLTAEVKADPGNQFQNLLRQTLDSIEHFQEVIDRDRITLAYQPIVELANGLVHHYEVLARLNGSASPFDWVTLGESIGMIATFDLTICRKALADLGASPESNGLRLAVNLSAQSLQDEVFLDALESLLQQHAGLCRRLSFELTESAEIRDFPAVDQAIQRIRSQGCEVGLDDFGAGSTSFQYLQAFDIDFVKLDGAYVRAMTSSQRDHALVKGMATICRDLGISMIAEMVESDEQLVMLKALGVGFGQGYRLGKPQTGTLSGVSAQTSDETPGAAADRAGSASPARRRSLSGGSAAP